MTMNADAMSAFSPATPPAGGPSRSSGWSDERRWQAVLGRDRSADGAFVYAVTSTGVFCRPSCPSRRGRRDRVIFFDVPGAAVRAGFRACKRCRPDLAVPRDPRLAVVERACERIAAATDGDPAPGLAALAADAGLSPQHFQRLFSAVIGVSPQQYADALRLDRLKAALKAGEGVASATYGAGYGSASRLYEQAPSRLGMTPATYAKGGRGARIVFTIVDAPAVHGGGAGLGLVLVAATARGICMIALGDDEPVLEAVVCAEFPAALISRDDGGRMAALVTAVLSVADGRGPHRDLPLDVRATAFQRQVWLRLQAIPPGETRTYAGIAADLGRPGAARAVGKACADNPLALVVPCHRAVGRDGRLHGYRWGLGRKAALLDREAGRR